MKINFFLLLLAFVFSPLYSAELEQYCTTSLAECNFHKTDCDINSTFEGKKYCFGNKKSKSIFLENPQETLSSAVAFYKKNNVERVKISQAEANEILDDPDCDFSNKDLGYLNFKGQDLTHCVMINTSFFGADLRDANLSGANLQRAYLNLARLEKANFAGAILIEATIFQPIFGDLSGANLRNTNLHRAELIQADLTGADLTGADLTGANVEDANFKDVIGLSKAKGFDKVLGKCRNCGM